MIERRKADDEGDAQQQVATDLSAAFRQVRAPEATLQVGIVELESRKAALELQRVIRLRRRVRTASRNRFCRRLGD
jgi:hypothetical protein